MAASSKQSKIIRSFREKLERLGCPYTEGVDESWIVDLVFRPGEPRIRLLQWLFARFDSTLGDLLDPSQASADIRMDSRIQRLLFVASSLGLCKADDVDLIRGVGSTSRQVAFMDTLLDIVCIMDSADDPQNKALQSPGIVSSSMTLDEQFRKDCWYLDSLASQCDMEQTFSSQAKLLPPDIMKTLERSRDEKGDQNKKLVVPDISRLRETAEHLSDDLEKQQQSLTVLMKQHPVPETDSQTMNKVSRTLRLVLSELSQLVVGFSYCYENEMRPWCNRTAPQLNQLGPAFKRVHAMLQQFTAVLHGLASIRQDYSQLSTTMKDKVHNITEQQDHPGLDAQKALGLASVGQAALESFQECVGILEESLVRSNNTFTTSPNSTLNAPVVKIT